MIPDDELVLDVDYRNGGEASFKDLETELGKLPDTLKVRTGSGDGSFQLRFQLPPGDLMSSLGPGIDVLKSGYVLIPGSKTAAVYKKVHAKGQPIPMEPATLPHLWTGRLKKIDRPSPEKLLEKAVERSVTEGRNNSGEWLARQLHDNRYLRSEIVRHLSRYQETVEDAKSGAPPYSRREAMDTVKSVCRNPRRDPWGAPSPASSASTPSSGLPLIPVGVLLNKKAVQKQWVWKDRLPVGGTSLISAKPKVGKTTLLTELGVRVARGEPFLGWKTKRGPVIFLFLEEHEDEIRQHLLRLGVTDRDPIHLLVGDDPGRDGIARLTNSVQEIRPALVVIDPLFDLLRVRNDDGNSYVGVKRALQPLHILARKTGAHIIGAVHRGKAERPGMEGILGSTGLQAGVDTLITYTVREQFRYFSTTQRYPRLVSSEERDIPETEAIFDPATGTTTLGRLLKEAEGEVIKKRLLAFLDTQTKPVLREAIEAAVTGSVGPVRRVLNDLVLNDEIARSGKGRKGDPYLFSRKP